MRDLGRQPADAEIMRGEWLNDASIRTAATVSHPWSLAMSARISPACKTIRKRQGQPKGKNDAYGSANRMGTPAA